MISRRQCLVDTTRLTHIGTHRHYDSIHNIYIVSNWTRWQHREREVDKKSHTLIKTPFAINIFWERGNHFSLMECHWAYPSYSRAGIIPRSGFDIFVLLALLVCFCFYFLF